MINSALHGRQEGFMYLKAKIARFNEIKYLKNQSMNQSLSKK